MDNDELLGRLCAHRGYHNPLDDNDPTRFLENTRLAYVRGFELLDRAECDVQLSADGEVFLLHDSCLARVAAVTDLVVPGEEGESGARRAQDAVLRSFWLVCTYPCDDLDEERASLLTSSDQVEELLGSLGRLGVGGVYLQYRPEVVTPALVRRLCEAGYGVGIWSGRPEHETPETVRAMVGAGVSLFNTDEPERLPELLRGSGGGSE